MEFEELQHIIQEHVALFPDSRTKVNEAEDLASTFLKIQHIISDYMLELELDMHEVRSMNKLLFHHALSKSDAKNATEKKAEAEADTEYRSAEKLERELKSKIIYLKAKQSIFNDAHLVCRTIMRD